MRPPGRFAIRDPKNILLPQWHLQLLQSRHDFSNAILPPFLESRWQQAPALLRAAVTGADRVVSSWPIVNRCGDHVLTRWVKRRDVRA